MTEFSSVVQEVTFAPAASPETVFRVLIGGAVNVTGGGGASAHADLTGRDAANAHPIGAVTGLQAALDAKASATMGVGGALSGALPSPGLNTEAVQDLVGAMAGDGMTYDDTAGTLDVVAPPHSVAWCLVADTFDPTVTPLPVTTSTNLYLYTAVQGDTYEHAGLWKGTSPDGTPALLERHPHTATTGDMFTSRTWIDLTSGSIVLPTEGPVDGTAFPAAWVSPQRVDAIISGNNGPNLPVWSLVVEQDSGGQSFAPTSDFLADFDMSTTPPAAGQVPVWDETDGAFKPGTVSGSLSDDAPQALGASASAGTASAASRADHVHARPSATDIGAVPTARTIAGLDLTTNRSAADLRTALNVADGAAALTSSTPAALGTAAVGVATAAARADHVHEAPAPDHSPGVISAARIAGGFATGTPLFAFTSSTTVAVATGTMVVAYGNRYARTDLVGLSINVSASSLTAGQTLTVVCYALDSDGLPTGSPVWSETITVGTSTGWLSTGTIARALPSQYAIGILNPSGNAGSVTLTAAQPVPSWVVAAASANRSGLTATSLSSAPDVSSFTIDSASSSTKWAPQQNVPIVWARRA